MRTFVAVDLPGELRAALAREQERLRALCSDNREIRWTAPETVHLTLKFLGETANDRLPAVTAALEALGPFEPFDVKVRGLGFFPDVRRPQVFWAGLDASPALPGLARRVDAALSTLGFPSERRPFAPHLTLARFRGPRADRALLREVENSNGVTLGAFEVHDYFLFESHLLPGGAEHKKVARFPRQESTTSP